MTLSDYVALELMAREAEARANEDKGPGGFWLSQEGKSRLLFLWLLRFDGHDNHAQTIEGMAAVREKTGRKTEALTMGLIRPLNALSLLQHPSIFTVDRGDRQFCEELVESLVALA